ncbi:unnamed protein product, partial [Prunus brigantina]
TTPSLGFCKVVQISWRRCWGAACQIVQRSPWSKVCWLCEILHICEQEELMRSVMLLLETLNNNILLFPTL